MWKFLLGVSKSESKRKVDTCESNKAYDATKRKRTLQLTGFKCTNGYILTESQLMSCDWCKKFGKDNPDGKFAKATELEPEDK